MRGSGQAAASRNGRCCQHRKTLGQDGRQRERKQRTTGRDDAQPAVGQLRPDEGEEGRAHGGVQSDHLGVGDLVDRESADDGGDVPAT